MKGNPFWVYCALSYQFYGNILREVDHSAELWKFLEMNQFWKEKVIYEEAWNFLKLLQLSPDQGRKV